MAGICGLVKKIAWDNNPLVDAVAWYGFMAPLCSMVPLKEVNEDREARGMNPISRYNLVKYLLLVPLEPRIKQFGDIYKGLE